MIMIKAYFNKCHFRANFISINKSNVKSGFGFSGLMDNRIFSLENSNKKP